MYPKGFIAIRIVQLVIAVVILGLDAYTLSEILTTSDELNIFTAIATIIITIYYIVVEFSASAWKSYNYWAVLALDIFALIFWLISFALMAAQTAPFANGFTVCGVYECIYYPLEGVFLTLFACMATVAGLGGVEFILFIVSLALHSVVMHRHRAAGGHCAPGSSSHHENGNHTNHNNTIPLSGGPVQEEKQQPAPSYATVPQQQQHQQQQQYYQQQPQQPQHQPYPTPTPPQGQAPYQPPPVANPQPYHGQQQNGGFGTPAPHAGSYEASAGPPQH